MAQRYHINPETGTVNICQAKKQECKFGLPQTEHYQTKEQAQQQYEKKQQQKFSEYEKFNKNNNTLYKKHFPTKTTAPTQQEADQKATELHNEYKKILQYLNKEQKHALSYYSFSGSKEIHSNFRKTPLKNVNEEDKKLINKISQNLSQAIVEQSPKDKERTLYHYIKNYSDKPLDKFIKENFLEKQEFSDKSVLSTSEDPSFISAYISKQKNHNQYIVFEIVSKDGISLQSREQERPGNLQSFEKERLLPTNKKFKIVHIREEKIKISNSRQKLYENFNPTYNINSIPKKISPKNTTIISMIDNDLL